jgi:formate dehydrogenase maturation protein FdhE
MKINRFNENNNIHKYLDDGDSGCCPVCGNCDTVDSTETQPNHDGMMYIYECNNCNFKWYTQYLMIKDNNYDYENSEEIIQGYEVPSNTFNKNMLKANKYNI